MISVINLLIGFFLPGLLEWWYRWTAVVEPVKTLGPDEYAKALSAIAGILILGLGGVLVIGLSGRWVRRWIFPKPEVSVEPSAGSKTGRADWAKPKPGSDEENRDS